ncbi:TrbI/VirB10 family protein [Niveispirillum irakense]|uniref:TrbI/VirB10 family protein n=1 Tax=Niveispirillum irakense TaxID=34011 RepID=UPI000403CF5B|nr:TrbI/VirB10 family protein [Niveispirillum irakense]
MTTAPPDTKQPPEKLELRAAPRRALRLRRGVIIGGIGIAAGAVLTLIFLSLQHQARKPDQNPELAQPAKPPAPEALAGLPTDYSQVKPDTPLLGPPLPGDLGRPILEHQRHRGAGTEWPPMEPTHQPTPEQVQASQARQSGLFFRTEPKSAPRAPASLNPISPSRALAAIDPTSTAEPDAQQRKLDFLAHRDTHSVYNPYAEQRPASPNQIMAGSIIAAALVTGLNSDLPGSVVAQVTENVHDSVTGQILLIPQGSRLIGTYDSRVSFGQERALLVWQRLIRPDGSSLQLDNLPASDTEGRSGLSDDVDSHTGRLLKGIAMATLLGVSTELTFGQQESELVRAVRESVQQNVDRASQRLVERNLDIQPTLTVRPGWPLRVIVRRDATLSPYRGG